MTNLEKYNQIFTEVFSVEESQLGAEFDSQHVDGWDSLMHITMISEVENRFDMRFSMKDVIGMKNVGEMASIIAERAKK